MAKKLDKRSRRKAWVLLILVVIAMLIPMYCGFKDGGTVQYRAVLYSVTKWHHFTVQDHLQGYEIGTQVRILFWEVYNDVQFVPDNIETTLSPAGDDTP